MWLLLLLPATYCPKSRIPLRLKKVSFYLPRSDHSSTLNSQLSTNDDIHKKWNASFYNMMPYSIQQYCLVYVIVSIFAEERHDLLLVSAFFQHPSILSSQVMISISNSRVYNSDDRRKVAILLPEIPSNDSIDDKHTDESYLQWHTDATYRLNQIANQFGLQQLSTIDESAIPSKEQQHINTHYLTAIPYPRTNSYALSISTLDQQSSSNKSRRQQKQTKKKKKLKLTEPFYIDLHPPSDSILGYRMNSSKQKNSGGGGSEMLIKALGIKKMISDKTSKEANDNQEEVIVYDLTAGLGRDSLVILSSYLDCIDHSNGNSSSNEYIPRLRVHMVERDPIVALLLKDAMRRLHQLASSNDNDERSKAQQITQCLSMEEGDGVTVLNRLKMLDKDKESAAAASSSDSIISYSPSYPPDVCYLDPMFPPRKKKSSAVKKDMAMLHSLLGTVVAVNEGEDDDTHDRIHEEQALLLAAYNSAQRRVVVKRPISALPLGLVADNSDCDSDNTDDDSNIPKPSYDVRGSVNRFDVYIITR